MSISPNHFIFQAVRSNNAKLLRQHLLCLKSSGRSWLECTLEKSGETLLHVCARTGHLDILRILCEEWACPELTLEVSDLNGKKCLHEAAQASQYHIASYLIKIGAKIDSLKSGDWTPLMLACTKVGSTALKTVEVLLRNGASPELTNKDGWTPLHIAVREGDVEIISLLLSFNSKVTAVTKNGRSVLHIAAFHGQENAIDFLLNSGASINCIDACGLTPLLEAVRGGHLEIVKRLLAKNAYLYQTDSMGLNCIHLSAQMGHLHMVIFLTEECGMNVNHLSQDTRLTPLHCAARAGQISTVNKLLELGADPCLLDSNGRSAADLANGPNGDLINAMLQNSD